MLFFVLAAVRVGNGKLRVQFIYIFHVFFSVTNIFFACLIN